MVKTGLMNSRHIDLKIKEYLLQITGRLLDNDPRINFLKYSIIFGTYFAMMVSHLYVGFLPGQKELFHDYLFTIPILLSSFAFGWRTSLILVSILALFHVPTIILLIKTGKLDILLMDGLVALIIIATTVVTGISADIIKKFYSDSVKEEQTLRKIIAEILLKEEQAEEKLSGVIYDDLLQSLAGILFKIESLNGTENASITEIGLHLRRIIESIQINMLNLNKNTLENLGFKVAANELIGKFLKNTQAKTRIKINVDEVNEKIGRLILKILRECLLNIEKHAKAEYVNISINRLDKNYFLIVKDDGIGFNLDKMDFTEHYGIRAMRNKALKSGGDFNIKSESGKGTIVKAILPAGENEG